MTRNGDRILDCPVAHSWNFDLSLPPFSSTRTPDFGTLSLWRHESCWYSEGWQILANQFGTGQTMAKLTVHEVCKAILQQLESQVFQLGIHER